MRWCLGRSGPAWYGSLEFGSRARVFGPHTLLAVVEYRAGCFISLCLRSLTCRTGMMTVPTPLNCGEDSWHGVPGTLSGAVMENGGNTVEVGAPSHPLFSDPRGREDVPTGEGQL